MKLKKFLAGLLSVALIMAPMTAMATSTNVEIDGDATYVDTNIMVVTLPTSTSLKFNLDPTGVYGYFKETNAASGATVTTGDLVDYAGKIVGGGYDQIINKSSVDIVVTCDYKLTAASGLNVVTAGDSAVTTTGNDVCLKIIGGLVSGGDYSVTTGDPETIVGTTSTKALVALEAVDYQFKLSGNDLSDGDILYVPVNDADQNVASFSIGGTISKDGDWSALEDASNFLKLSCVYSFKAAKDVTVATIDNGFVRSGENNIEYLEAAAAAKTYSISSSSKSVTLDDYVGKTLSSVTLVKTDASTLGLKETNHYTFNSTTGAFAIVSDAIVSNNVGGSLKLVFSDGAEVSVKIQ